MQRRNFLHLQRVSESPRLEFRLSPQERLEILFPKFSVNKISDAATASDFRAHLNDSLLGSERRSEAIIAVGLKYFL